MRVPFEIHFFLGYTRKNIQKRIHKASSAQQSSRPNSEMTKGYKAHRRVNSEDRVEIKESRAARNKDYKPRQHARCPTPTQSYRRRTATEPLDGHLPWPLPAETLVLG